MGNEKPDRPLSGFWYEALRYTTLGWELALPIFGGVLAGYYLDLWLDSAPTYTLGLLVAGLGISAYNIWHAIQRLDARNKQSPPADFAELDVSDSDFLDLEQS